MSTARPSKNNRHDTLSDVKVFLERERPDRAKTVEVVCSSARRDMDRHSTHVPFRLFCETMRLFPECVAEGAAPTAERWPAATEYACWHCCHPFDSVPIPIPKAKRLSENDSISVYTVYGIFCSCNCAVAYILERNMYDQQQLLLRFKNMMTAVFQFNTDDVFSLEPAPPRIFLTMFGGHMSIDEFRRASLTTRTALLMPPFISYSMVLEENARQSAGQVGDVTNDTIAPITTHVIRGLRRPTQLAAAADDDDVPMEAQPPSSAFDAFVRAKVEQQQEVASAEVTTEAVPKRGPRGKSSKRGAASAGKPVTGGAGTLAAFLQ
jgi:hypothetical protein